MNCYQAKAGELAKQWYVIDASEAVVGRLAAQVAPILMGKHRPTYTPYIDTGDFVIITNVDKVVFTGNKWQQKFYQRYSGHPGGQKEEQAWKLFQRHPDRILWLAIQRMMPKNKIGRHMMGKLKLIAGSEHEHQAQSPIPLEPISGRPAASGIMLAPKSDKMGPGANAARAVVTRSRLPLAISLAESLPSDGISLEKQAEFIELTHRKGMRLPKVLRLVIEPDMIDRVVTASEVALPPSTKLATESLQPIARVESRTPAVGSTGRREGDRDLEESEDWAEPESFDQDLDEHPGIERMGRVRPTKRPIVWIDGEASDFQGLDSSNTSTLNIQMGDPSRHSIVDSHAGDFFDHDIPDEGLLTEWLVSSNTVRLSDADDPSVFLEEVSENAWLARFKLLIPKEGESEVRRLGVTPLCGFPSTLGVLLIALANEQEGAPSEIYRHFTIDLPIAGTLALPKAIASEVETANLQ